MFLRSKVQVMMLRKRSRPVTNNKHSIASPSSPITNTKSKSTSPFPLSSPRFLLGLSPKATNISSDNSDHCYSMSPTSTLEPRPFSHIPNPILPHTTTPNTTTTAKITKPIGLGLIEALKADDFEKKSEDQDSRMVLFGSKLKIQIPPFQPCAISPTGSVESPCSSTSTSHRIEFGIKNKSSQLALCSPIDRSPIGSNGCLMSPRDIELLEEEYTCVISHGPNPKTTHIFDNRVVESCGIDGLILPLRGESDIFSDRSSRDSSDFLSFCHACKKDLGQGRDIFMYRGERAFCSSECRYQEMMFDEAMD